MIGGRSVLAVIPARGGSKGVPRKNSRSLAGRPLIAWTIEEARKSVYIDRLILSSDDAGIIESAISLGCEAPFVRPAELSQDHTPGVEPVIHAMNTLQEQYDVVLLLQITSPLRTVEDIDGCLLRMVESGAKACVSLAEAPVNPHWMYSLNDCNRLLPVMHGHYSRRQELPEFYALNGAVYAAEAAWLRSNRSFIGPETIGFIMPRERSVDIDTELDFSICESLIGNPTLRTT